MTDPDITVTEAPQYLMAEARARAIRCADDLMLLRMAVTQDLGSIVESNIRLRRSNEKLAKITIWLTGAILLLTLVLSFDAILRMMVK